MSNEKKLIRRPVPALPKGAASIGKVGVVKRSFDHALGKLLRCRATETFELTIVFTEPVGEALVVCYTDLNSKEGRWEDVPFKRRRDGVYHLSVRPAKPGMYGFRIKYSFDKGRSWIWDRVPLMSVHADPLEMANIRCYTLIPNVSGKVTRWIAELDRIKEMGFNMVHLLPVTEMDESQSPYSAKRLFSFDPSYYDAAQHPDGMAAFESFVQAAKEKGIALCIDLVLNHIGPGSDLATKHPDWIKADRSEKDGMKRSGCWHMNAWLKWEDLVKIDYDHPNQEKKMAVWDYMKAYALFWASYADYTGGMVRLDNLHNSDEEFIEWMINTLRAAYPELVIHAEFFSDANTTLKRAREWDINLLLANQWEYPYAENLRRYLSYIHDIAAQVPFYAPVTTHDTGAPAELFGSARAVVPRYFITALMATGKTGMVQGTEHGVPAKVNFIGRSRDFPYETDPWIVSRVTAINSLLARFDVLHEAQNIRFVDGRHGAAIGAYRPIDTSSGLLLLANLDTVNSHHVDVDLSEVFGADVVTMEDLLVRDEPFAIEGVCQFSIPPCGVAAYAARAQR